jgi:protein SCO1/2
MERMVLSAMTGCRRLVATMLVAGTAMMWPSLGSTQVGLAPSVPSSAGGPFALTTVDGSRVTDRSFRGKWLMVYFGYTFCPDICPTTLMEIGNALVGLGPRAERVQALFITLDPRRDTQIVLADYMASFDPRIMALTGTPEEVAVAAKAYRVFYERHDTDDGGYLYDHSSYVYIMDADGRFVIALAGDTSGVRLADEVVQRMSAAP